MSKKEKNDSGFIPLSELDAQEGLTLEKLKSLYIGTQFIANRPKDSYIELVDWVDKNFGAALKGSGKISRFVHNKIIIDGTFLQFAKETNVSITPLFVDTVVSWKSDFDNEKFFAQGIFKIETDKTKFLHFALFQKGNQHEDEISFGILVNEENFDSYIALRNEYDEWLFKRDRSNLQIRVIEGEDIPYERDFKWEDIFLPETLKNNIKLTVEGFLKSKEIYDSQKIPWKRGIILWGHPGNGKTSLIRTIISNYDFKPVTVLPSANDDSMREAFAYAQEQNPALLYFEDLDSLLQNINVSLFLNLLDGISTKNGVFIIATANNLDKLGANIKDRPSRFDRKFEIPLPDESMNVKYFKKWFGKILSNKEVEKLAAFSYKNEFSYAYVKELYISSVYIAIADDRVQPTFADIELAMEQLMADKFRKHKSIGIDKYLDDKNSRKKK